MKRFFLLFVLVFGILIIFTLVTNIGIYVATKPFIYDDSTRVPDAEAALIPGAAVLRDGALSPIFRDRVDTAITLYEEKKVLKILVSGDNSTVSHNE